jgi:hypothetical protein
MNILDPQRPTEVITHRVGLCLRHLFPLSIAGMVCGLPRGRAEEWVERGRRGERGFVGFFRQVRAVAAELQAAEDDLAAATDGIRRRAAAGDAEAIECLRTLLDLPEALKAKIRAGRAKLRRAAWDRAARGKRK